MRDEVARKLALSYEELTAHCSCLEPGAWNLKKWLVNSGWWLGETKEGKNCHCEGRSPEAIYDSYLIPHGSLLTAHRSLLIARASCLEPGNLK